MIRILKSHESGVLESNITSVSILLKLNIVDLINVLYL